MNTIYQRGIPTEDEYVANVKSNRFQHLEEFSDGFLLKYKTYLRRYALKWVSDPLHQWSRRWEYPFVLDRLEPCLQAGKPSRILDAGSGVTFFPYYLASEYPGAEIDCCDQDESFAEIFNRINGKAERRVDFVCAGLSSMPYSDSHFDSIYCISVLEHTADFPAIIRELHRVLKPGGKLIVTFDLSLDRKYAVSPEQAELLLKSFSNGFSYDDPVSQQVASEATAPGIFSTRTAEEMDPASLPWNKLLFPLLWARALLTGKGWLRWPPLLTVYCLSLTKNP